MTADALSAEAIDSGGVGMFVVHNEQMALRIYFVNPTQMLLTNIFRCCISVPDRHKEHTMRHLLTTAELDQLIADHARNMAALRASGTFAKYGSALRGTGDVQPGEADAFRAAPVWGAGL